MIYLDFKYLLRYIVNDFRVFHEESEFWNLINLLEYLNKKKGAVEVNYSGLL